jgi:parallel beta-helix repeat protein
MRRLALLAPLFVFAGLYAAPTAVLAAESYDNCAGFIDSLPATIGKQGVWCLRKDLSTALASGAAITVATNNVTVDCNDFKIGGLGAGDASQAWGIFATDRQNITVRHCNIRGFRTGIDLYGGAGHLVEDNRLDNNLASGIEVQGDNNLIRRNRVFDTGGQQEYGYGIVAIGADVINNIISGVFTAPAVESRPYGILAGGSGTAVQGNRIRGLIVSGPGPALGIAFQTKGVIVDGNQITANATTTGNGIGRYGNATPDADATCSNNIVRGFTGGYSGCVIEVGNIDLP